MALKAGRVGVYPSDLDKEGHIKQNEVDPYVLPVANASTLGGVKPVAKTSDMTQDVGVDAEGKLYVEEASGGTELYYKDYPMTRDTNSNIATDSSILISGYTPISCAIRSRYTGYSAYGSIFHGSGSDARVIGYAPAHAISTDDFIARVYYMAGSPTELT